MKWRLALFMTVLLALAACSGGQRHYDVDRSEFPVKGIDISGHNGSVDFAKAKADSIDFVYIKATEGIDFCDVMFARNCKGAKAAGLKVGAYHFFRFGTPGHLQAYHFLSTVGQYDLDLPLAIDVEDWYNDEGVDDSEVREQLRVMVDALASNGMRVMIYTNKEGYGRFVDSFFPDVDLWICSLGAKPPTGDWAVWQHSHCGKVSGIETPVDVDAFCGSRADFDSWLSR